MTGPFCNSFMNIYNRCFNAPKLLQYGHYDYGKVMAYGYYYDKKNLCCYNYEYLRQRLIPIAAKDEVFREDSLVWMCARESQKIEGVVVTTLMFFVWTRAIILIKMADIYL